MKHTLEEIEALLSTISPWPWYWEKMRDYTVYDKNHDEVVCDTGKECRNIVEVKFIAQSPEIIADLVEEVKRLRQIVHVVNTTPGETITLQAMADHNGITITELKKGFESK